MREAVIVDAIRTPIGKGKPGGGLSGWHPVDLLAATLDGVLARNDVEPASVDDVIAGCVSQAGEQTLNVARNAVLAAGLPESVPATTIDRQCGSSQQALHFATQAIVSNSYDTAIAAGVESMSRVPMWSSLMGMDPYSPGITARYEGGLIPQGISAELIAAKWGLSRNQLDSFAARSHELLTAASARGGVERELLPIDVDRGEGPTGETMTQDEGARPGTTPDSLADLKPAFEDPAWLERFPQLKWVIHAGNSSQISDGAAATLLMERSKAEQLGLQPRARVHSMAVVGDDPIYMLTGVIPATSKVLDRAGLTVDDIDAFEVNEAFAPVVLAWLHETGADPERVNQHGGAIANGHPLGATGAKLMATLINVLEQREGRFGLQVVCEGGGMANATIIERLG